MASLPIDGKPTYSLSVNSYSPIIPNPIHLPEPCPQPRLSPACAAPTAPPSCSSYKLSPLRHSCPPHPGALPLILLNPQTYRLYHARTSARTAVVSQPTLPATHPPLITRENLPLRPNLRSPSSPSVLFPQTLSPPMTPDNREVPIEYP